MMSLACVYLPALGKDVKLKTKNVSSISRGPHFSNRADTYLRWILLITNWRLSLTLSWRRPLSYRNQSIDLLCKSMDWFLYDNGPRHERDKVKQKVTGFTFKLVTLEKKDVATLAMKSKYEMIIRTRFYHMIL